jgi:hypothetical protein
MMVFRRGNLAKQRGQVKRVIQLERELSPFAVAEEYQRVGNFSGSLSGSLLRFGRNRAPKNGNLGAEFKPGK